MDYIDVFLNPKNSKPLYYQLYSHLLEEIQTGRLAAGTRLPGKRTAATQLGVGVNTVDQAYQMLVAEGYVRAKPRSGFVVNRVEQILPLPIGETKRQSGTAPAQRGTHWRYSFASGGTDPGLFPRKAWNRVFREVLAEEAGLFELGDPLGDGVLREAVALYLQGYRGVHCDAGQIVVGAGLEVLLGYLARLLPGAGVAVENPGYPKAAHILHNAGANIQFVEVDRDGMPSAALEATRADMAYLTPSHQFPTGAVMPAPRRTELLQWAAKRGRYIIEDDYDSEFRFDARPLPSLQGLDRAQRVIYAGTFSRALAPGLRIAYLVLPPDLLQRWTKVYGEYACTVSRPEQYTLARFMRDGHFYRSLNRMRNTYRKRRNLLLKELANRLPVGGYTTENIHTGLYFILRVPGKSALEIAARARKAGILLRAVDEYRRNGQQVRSKTTGDLVLGYGGLPEESVGTAVEELATLL